MTVKSSISLTDQQDAFARDLVENGRYPSVSAVVQQGLDLLRRRIEDEEAETAALKALIDERRSGPTVSSDVMHRRVSDMLVRKRRDHGVDS